LVFEQLALKADAIAADLCERFGMVAWDRERVVGAAQRRMYALANRDVSSGPGRAVGVLERRSQPLEALPVVWTELRRGNHVHLHQQPGSSSAVASLLAPVAAQLAQQLPTPPLVLATGPCSRDADIVGVSPAETRVAIVDARADRELAAYLLARVSLRRSGCDPRAVKRVFAWGDRDGLIGVLRRLWLGVVMGPPEDHRSFAGPVPTDVRAAYLEANQRWQRSSDIDVICPGEQLICGSDEASFLAPTLIEVPWEQRTEVVGALLGPVLAIHWFANRGALDRALASEGFAPARQLVIGDQTSPHGALMLERLPPGMPRPRPI